MSSYADILSNGSKLLIVGGNTEGFFPEEIRKHPQVVVWTDNKAQTGDIPSDVKAVVLTRAIKHPTFKNIYEQARKRRLLLVPGFKSQGDVIRTLRKLEKHEPVELKTASLIEEEIMEEQLREVESSEVQQRKGDVRQFVIQRVDLSKPTGEEAERLFELAKQNGLKTTIGSISQVITKRRRELGISATVRSVAPRRTEPAHRTLLRDIDNAIAAFQLMREHVDNLVKENEELHEFKANFQKKFKELFGD